MPGVSKQSTILHLVARLLKVYSFDLLTVQTVGCITRIDVDCNLAFVHCRLALVDCILVVVDCGFVGKLVGVVVIHIGVDLGGHVVSGGWVSSGCGVCV